jgi:hypothetical protein
MNFNFQYEIARTFARRNAAARHKESAVALHDIRFVRLELQQLTDNGPSGAALTDTFGVHINSAAAAFQ